MAKPEKVPDEQASLIPLADSAEVLSPGALGAMAQAQAEVAAAVHMAQRFPRDWDVVREKLLKECKRPIFAAGREPGKGAIYSKPIGNGHITGLSIRFAEAAIAAAGHIHVTVRTLSETDEQRKLNVKVWDATSMISFADEITIEKTVERKVIPKGAEILRTRLNKQGELLYIVRADGDSLLNKENAAKSKSIRNSALRLMPSWLLDHCREELEATIRAKDAEDPDQAKHQILDAFSKLGVTVEQIKKFLGHDASAISADELLQLRGLYTAVRDGEATIQSVFQELDEEQGEKSKAQSIRDRLRERKKTAGPTPSTAEPKAPSSESAAEPSSAPPQSVATEQESLATESELHTAVGTVLDTTSGRGSHFLVLKEGQKFRLPNAEAVRSARQRIGKRVILHLELRDGEQVVQAIENE